MGKLSRNKGNTFERKVAKMILAVVPGRFTTKDCYRTPLSGGHPIADSGDLVISERLQKKFPYVTECKHYRNWSAAELLPPSLRVQQWVEQARKAAEQTSSLRHIRPWLLIMRGNFTQEYCVFGWHPGTPPDVFPYVQAVRVDVGVTYAMRLSDFLCWQYRQKGRKVSV